MGRGQPVISSPTSWVASLVYRISNLGIWLDEDESLLSRRAAEKLGVDAKGLGPVRVVRKILDARKRNHPRFVYVVDVEVEPGKRMPAVAGDVQLAPGPETE